MAGAGAEWGDLFLRMPLPRAHTILPPSDPAGKMEWGEESGLGELLSL